MRTSDPRNLPKHRSLRLTGLLALALLCAPAAPAHADEPAVAPEAPVAPATPPTPAAPAAPAATAAPAAPAAPAKAAASRDEIFSAHAQAGYSSAKAEDNRAFLLPYDPLTSGPVFGFDLLFLRPAIGTINADAHYLGTRDWDAAFDYNRGADLDVKVGAQKFTHAREHEGLPADAKATTAFGELLTHSEDADPGARYEDTIATTNAALKLRIPGYPAHLRASARIQHNTGEQQMQYFFRSCSTELCHLNSRTRSIDQETRELALGADAHAGPIDIAYTHTALTYRDRLPDPVDAFGDLTYLPGQSTKAGNYPHDGNPDLRSFADDVKVNTNLSNRVVLSLAFTRSQQENETTGITRGDQHAGVDVSYLLTPTLFLVVRGDYEQERTVALSAAAEAARVQNNINHVTAGETYQHVVRPEYTRWSDDLALRWQPRSGTSLRLSVGQRASDSKALIEKVGTTWDDSGVSTRTTVAGLDGRWRAGSTLELDGQLGQEWTTDPEYAIDNTRLTRYGVGAGWTPSTLFALHASYRGSHGSNTDAASLQRAYSKQAAVDQGFDRSTNGNSYTVTAAFTPDADLAFTAAYTSSDSGIVQDMMFGAPSKANAGNFYVSPDTSWSGRTQLADLRAAWSATRRLKLTAEGMWIRGHESYDPNFAADSTLQELSTLDFAKVYASLQADVQLSDGIGLTVTGFWTQYDDRQDNAGDGRALGALAAVDVRF
jgi:hypothetical protein